MNSIKAYNEMKELLTIIDEYRKTNDMKHKIDETQKKLQASRDIINENV